jgi:catechol 2,3-dioxygenase-like lactoylglutathione lyase family enzyme
MNYPVTGIHHITACAGGAQQDIDFFTQILGLRMVKQTVLMDGKIPIYHLYYANAHAEPGSVMTTFPYGQKKGRQGSGQISATAYSAPKGSLPFWKEHFDRHKVPHAGIQERFGQKFIRFQHPAGLAFEVLEEANDNREGWTTEAIGKGESVRGFYGTILSMREVAESERFFTEALGFRKTGQEGPYHRFEVGKGGPAGTLILHHEPDRPAGQWTFGAGTVHHVALAVNSREQLEEQKGIYEELGFTDASEVKDRYYFYSMYVRSPGGILVECSCSQAGGFFRDEDEQHLGSKLHLPPWWEHRTQEMLAQLEPIHAPELARN